MAKGKILKEIEDRIGERRGAKPKTERTPEWFRKKSWVNAMVAATRLWDKASDKELYKKDHKAWLALQQYCYEMGAGKPALALQIGGEKPMQFIFELAREPMRQLPAIEDIETTESDSDNYDEGFDSGTEEENDFGEGADASEPVDID